MRRAEYHNDHVLSFIVRGQTVWFYRWLLHSLGIESPPGAQTPELERLLPPEWAWEGAHQEIRTEAARASGSRHRRARAPSGRANA